MTRNYVEIYQARAKEIDALRGKYQLARAEAAVLGSNPVTQRKLLSLARMAASYLPGESGEKAIYLLANISLMLGTLIEPLLIIERFESKEADFEKLTPPVE